MNWIFLAILTAFFFGTYNVFIKIASGHINQIVGAVILQVVAALLGSLLLLILKMNGSTLAISQKGIFYAVMAGLFVGLAEITSFFCFLQRHPRLCRNSDHHRRLCAGGGDYRWSVFTRKLRGIRLPWDCNGYRRDCDFDGEVE